MVHARQREANFVEVIASVAKKRYVAGGAQFASGHG
jgi:hypothetical protein